MLPKIYEHKDVEERIYKFWQDKALFTPLLYNIADKKGNFSIVMPPPNITGSLHMGHALNNTLQDVIVRFRRMQGYNTLWLPGIDHAGIATQNVVEKMLHKVGLTREYIGREEFIKKVWEWKQEYGEKIITQLKKLGCSCDWQRLKFTLDEDLSRTVNEVFVKLYKENLIYKDYYIVNWCPRCRTALADIEVNHRQQQGRLYYIKYPFLNREGHISVATTRPETMLGDTAVAVNPEDTRYIHLVGEEVIVPLIERKIKIIADARVKKDFGTGCVKITPCHDPQDFIIAKEHNLEFINILNQDGTMNEYAGEEFSGLDRFACREAVISLLQKKNLVEKIEEDYTYSLGHCYRCDTIIEPYYSKQWFLKTKELAKKAIDVVQTGKLKFIPQSWKREYLNWLKDIKDWCISRQIWWGHRIPIWYCKDCCRITSSVVTPSFCWHCRGKNIYQDEDVLDTWFSSALWPFSTLGWQDNGHDFRNFYPTSLLISGFDIIFFWISRMVMMGLKFTKAVPFKEVYIHGLVRDEHGKKMSKSAGNVIDPIQTIEEYGADALRFCLSTSAGYNKDILLSKDRIKASRYFCNKLWNAARLILANVEEGWYNLPREEELRLELSDKWIQSKLKEVIITTTEALNNYRFDVASTTLYDFIWHEYCDWYLELAKLNILSRPAITKYILITTYQDILRLLHPFMPFITEELWQKLPIKKDADSIMVSSYPKASSSEIDTDSIKNMEIIKSIVVGIRNIRHDMNIAPQVRLVSLIKPLNEKALSLAKEYSHYIAHLAGCSSVVVDIDLKRPKHSAGYITEEAEIYIQLETTTDWQKHINKLKKELEKKEEEARSLKEKLSNPLFLERAPKEIVEEKRRIQKELTDKIHRIISIIEGLEE